MSADETDLSTSDETEDVAIHVVAIEHFERAIRALNSVSRKLESGELGVVDDAQKKSTELRRALQTVFEERKRAYDLGEKASFEDGDDAGDIDSLRDALHGQLSRLVGEGEDESVSG